MVHATEHRTAQHNATQPNNILKSIFSFNPNAGKGNEWHPVEAKKKKGLLTYLNGHHKSLFRFRTKFRTLIYP